MMRDLNAFEKHIAELRNATNDIEISCSLAYNNGPDVGIRKICNGDRSKDFVMIDGIVWLIAGDAYACSHNGEKHRLQSVFAIRTTPIEEITVELRAQAIVMSNIVTVYLGRRCVYDRSDLSTESVVLKVRGD